MCTESKVPRAALEKQIGRRTCHGFDIVTLKKKKKKHEERHKLNPSLYLCAETHSESVPAEDKDVCTVTVGYGVNLYI